MTSRGHSHPICAPLSTMADPTSRCGAEATLPCFRGRATTGSSTARVSRVRPSPTTNADDLERFCDSETSRAVLSSRLPSSAHRAIPALAPFGAVRMSLGINWGRGEEPPERIHFLLRSAQPRPRPFRMAEFSGTLACVALTSNHRAQYCFSQNGSMIATRWTRDDVQIERPSQHDPTRPSTVAYCLRARAHTFKPTPRRGHAQAL